MCRLYFLESTQEGKGEVFDTNDKTKALTINNSTCKSTKDVNSGLALACYDIKSHFCEIWKFCHNWPKMKHKMGLDTSNVSSPLYIFSSPFLLGDLVNANPVNSNEKKHFTHFETETKKVKISEILALWRRRSLANTKSFLFFFADTRIVSGSVHLTSSASAQNGPQLFPMSYQFSYNRRGLILIMAWAFLRVSHRGRAMHIWIGKLTIIGSDNGLSPGRRQAIIWTNAGILLIRPLGTNFSEILIGNQTFSFKKMHLKILSAKWRPFYLGLNVV